VNRERAIEQLPETHAAALRLRARGFDDDAIAAALAVPPEAVPGLLQIADEKLAALLARPAANATPPRHPPAVPPAARRRKGEKR
jgi:hypothetical protein